MSRRPGNRTTTQKKAKVAAAGYWGEITLRDKKMVDEGWHRFWSKRGSSPTKEELPDANQENVASCKDEEIQMGIVT